jgi:trimeric autotransporter adhesin
MPLLSLGSRRGGSSAAAASSSARVPLGGSGAAAAPRDSDGSGYSPFSGLAADSPRESAGGSSSSAASASQVAAAYAADGSASDVAMSPPRRRPAGGYRNVPGSAGSASSAAGSTDNDLSPVSRLSTSSSTSCLTPRKIRRFNRQLPLSSSASGTPAAGAAAATASSSSSFSAAAAAGAGGGLPPRPPISASAPRTLGATVSSLLQPHPPGGRSAARRGSGAGAAAAPPRVGGPRGAAGLAAAIEGDDENGYDSDAASAVSSSYGSGSVLSAPPALGRLPAARAAQALRSGAGLRSPGRHHSGASSYVSSASGSTAAGGGGRHSSAGGSAGGSGSRGNMDLDMDNLSDSVSTAMEYAVAAAAAAAGSSAASSASRGGGSRRDRASTSSDITTNRSVYENKQVAVRSRARALQRGATAAFLETHTREITERNALKRAAAAAAAASAATAAAAAPSSSSPSAAATTITGAASSSSASSSSASAPTAAAGWSNAAGARTAPLASAEPAMWGAGMQLDGDGDAVADDDGPAAHAASAAAGDAGGTGAGNDRPASPTDLLFVPPPPEPVIRTRRQTAQEHLSLHTHHPGQKAARLGTHGRRVVKFTGASSGAESEGADGGDDYEDDEDDEDGEDAEGGDGAGAHGAASASPLTVDTSAPAAAAPSPAAVTAAAAAASASVPTGLASSRSRRMLAAAVASAPAAAPPAAPVSSADEADHIFYAPSAAPSPMSAAASSLATVHLGGARSGSSSSAAAADDDLQRDPRVPPSPMRAPLPPAFALLAQQFAALDTAILLTKRRNRGNTAGVGVVPGEAVGVPLYDSLKAMVEQGTSPPRDFPLSQLAAIVGLAPSAYRLSAVLPPASSRASSGAGGHTVALRLAVDIDPTFGRQPGAAQSTSASASMLAADSVARRAAFQAAAYGYLWRRQLEALTGGGVSSGGSGAQPPRVPPGLLVPQVAAGTAWHPKFKAGDVAPPAGELPELVMRTAAAKAAVAVAAAAASAAPPAAASPAAPSSPSAPAAAASAAAAPAAAPPAGAPAASPVAATASVLSPQAVLAARRARLQGKAVAKTSELIAAAAPITPAAVAPAADGGASSSSSAAGGGVGTDAATARQLPVLLERLLRALGGDTGIDWEELGSRLWAPGVLPAAARLVFGTPPKLEAGVVALAAATGGWFAVVDTAAFGRSVRVASKADADLARARAGVAAVAAAAAPVVK